MFHEELTSKNTDITYNIFLNNFSFFRLNISPSHYFLPILFLCILYPRNQRSTKFKVPQQKSLTSWITSFKGLLNSRVGRKWTAAVHLSGWYPVSLEIWADLSNVFWSVLTFTLRYEHISQLLWVNENVVTQYPPITTFVKPFFKSESKM